MSSYLAAVGLPTDDAAHCERILYRFDCAFIVCLAGRPVGLFKYYRDVHGWHIVQIQIARQQQGRGMGTRLLSTVLDEACRNQQPARLGVLKSNPAKQLYERLGFEVVSEDREEYAMLFRPGNGNLTYAASAQHLR